VSQCRAPLSPNQMGRQSKVSASLQLVYFFTDDWSNMGSNSKIPLDRNGRDRRQFAQGLVERCSKHHPQKLTANRCGANSGMIGLTVLVEELGRW
jgi:hypothetical protein